MFNNEHNVNTMGTKNEVSVDSWSETMDLPKFSVIIMDRNDYCYI